MWSPHLCGIVVLEEENEPAFAGVQSTLLHITNLQTPQPTGDVAIVEDVSKRFTFQIDVGACVTHRGVEVRMTEPLADGSEVYARFEHTDGGCVSKRMRMDAFPGQGRAPFCSSRYVFS